LPSPEVALVHGDGGEVDLREADFTNTVFSPWGYWQSYPERLYTPADLEYAEIEDYGFHERQIQYATHAMTLRLPIGKIYGVRVSTADYSMRLFINGEELGQAGVPGISPDTTTPRVLPQIFYFKPETDTTSIVIQISNFAHWSGSYTAEILIGEAQVIGR
jgi:hypothetical protein